jgi:hypothetical protein
MGVSASDNGHGSGIQTCLSNPPPPANNLSASSNTRNFIFFSENVLQLSK